MRRSSILALGLGTICIAIVAIFLWLRVAGYGISPPHDSTAPSAPPPNLERVELAVVEQPDERSTVTTTVPSASIAPYQGLVVDQSGKPIQNVTVSLYPTPGNWQQQEPVGSAPSGADGRFEIFVSDVEGAGPPLRVVAQAAGYGGFSMNPVFANKEIRIQLNQEVELFGTVLDAANEAPIVGATVEGGGDAATTDEHGRYRLLPGLCVGLNYSVTADRDGYARATTNVLIGAPVPTEHVIRMRRGVALRIEVFDSHTSGAIAGAHMKDGRGGVLGETDAQGVLEIRVARDSELRIGVESPGYADLWWTWLVTGAEPLKIVRLPMIPFAWIDGFIHDETGNPIAECVLYASAEDRAALVDLKSGEGPFAQLPGEPYWKLPAHTSAVSDERGRFTHPVIPSHSPYTIHANHKDYVGVASEAGVLATPGQRISLDLKLIRGATIKGNVRYNGQPWTGGDIHFEDEEGHGGGYARIDEEGRYELRNVPAGRMALKLRDQLLRRSPLPPPTTLVVEALKEYQQDISWEEAFATITGRVLDPHGAPVKGENVDAVEVKNQRRFRAWTLEDGTFSIQVAPGGTYDIRVYRPPAGDGRSNVPAGTTGIDLVLPEIGKLHFRLVDSVTKAPIQPPSEPGRGILWRTTAKTASGWLDAKVDHSGLAIVQLPVGSVDLTFNWESDEYVTREVLGVLVRSEENSEPLVIDLERGASVRLVLLGEGLGDLLSSHSFVLAHKFDRGASSEPAESGGLTLNGVKVIIEGGRYDRLLDFNPEGVVVLDGLDLGRKEVMIVPNDLLLDPPAFEAREPSAATGERPTVEIRLRRK